MPVRHAPRSPRATSALLVGVGARPGAGTLGARAALTVSSDPMRSLMFRSVAAATSLPELVGRHGRVTRLDDAAPADPLSAPELDAVLLSCPDVGCPLVALVGGSTWLQTTPVMELATVVDREWFHLFVCTEDARYGFVYHHAQWSGIDAAS
jgi:hypothetical protein